MFLAEHSPHPSVSARTYPRCSRLIMCHAWVWRLSEPMLYQISNFQVPNLPRHVHTDASPKTRRCPHSAGAVIDTNLPPRHSTPVAFAYAHVSRGPRSGGLRAASHGARGAKTLNAFCQR